MNLIMSYIKAFMDGWYQGANPLNRQDKKLRANLHEKKVDKMVADSFPASDPPSTY